MLEWKKELGNLTYELFWDNGAGANMTKLIITEENRYAVKKAFGTGEFTFKVRGKNDCGASPFSPKLLVNFGEPRTPPNQMKEVLTSM